ncbi:MAG: IclR family transcriptional regulator [Hyphomicrobiales bacterium]|nr:IclR family transcriptional regulator [Hyphomicrobiales bacterium]
MANARSASRALSMFETFGAEGRPLLLTELAPLIDVPLSSCHGLVRTLLDRGYLYALSRRRGFYPTRKLYTLAQTIAAKDSYLQRLAPFLERLRDDSGETVIVGTLQGEAVLYLEVLEGPKTIRYSARPGDFKPLHSSAIGKALLSAGGEALWKKLAARPLSDVTVNTITDPAHLRDNLEEGARRGYFVTRGENVSDVTAIATALEVEGMTLGIAIAGPSYRMAETIEAQTGRLLQARSEIEERLG